MKNANQSLFLAVASALLIGLMGIAIEWLDLFDYRLAIALTLGALCLATAGFIIGLKIYRQNPSPRLLFGPILNAMIIIFFIVAFVMVMMAVRNFN